MVLAGVYRFPLETLRTFHWLCNCYIQKKVLGFNTYIKFSVAVSICFSSRLHPSGPQMQRARFSSGLHTLPSNVQCIAIEVRVFDFLHVQLGYMLIRQSVHEWRATNSFLFLWLGTKKIGIDYRDKGFTSYRINVQCIAIEVRIFDIRHVQLGHMLISRIVQMMHVND